MGEEKPKKRYLLIKICTALGALGLISVVFIVGALYLYITPNLPDPYLLDNVELQEPLRIYSADNKLIAEYGDKRRIPTPINAIPQRLQQAFIAAEDDRFYKHPGVDYQGLLRAAFQLALTGKKKQGGSTITMQVARNFFLSKKKTFKRKFEEIFLSLKMERVLSKDKILELYMNKIFLGKRAYGVASAAKVYYGKELEELSLAQMAMIAGLPKAPSKFNPVNNPDRAFTRRNYVLGRMLKLGFIQQEEYDLAMSAELTAQEYQVANELKAPYIGEMARAFVQTHFQDEDIYNNGLKVYTTVVADYQRAANRAIYKGLLDYEHRRGYVGSQAKVDNIDAVIEAINVWQQASKEASEELIEINDETILQLHEKLAQYPTYGPLESAVVLKVEEQSAIVYNEERALAVLPWQGLEWAKKRINIETVGRAPEAASEVLAVGDIVYIRNDLLDEEKQPYLALSQLPKVEGALVSVEPATGAILAIVGGFDYFKNKFNRAMQAERQPGSSFKPFVYTAGLEQGFTTASIINDAPVVFDYPELEGRWKPENYSGKFYGPTRLREGLVKSRNLISIRLLIALGIKEARNYVRRFGFTDKSLPYDLSLALGSGMVKPIELAKAYATFANGGYRVDPFFVDRIEDRNGKVIYYTDHSYVCAECLDENGDAIVDSEQQKDLMQEVNQELQSIKTSNTLIDQVSGDEDVLLRANFPATRIVAADTHFLIHSLLNEVTIRGTGARATRELNRRDLAGKTGTTNDQNDAWFSGYHRKAVGIVWVGYDNHNPLGAGETGTKTALPIWIDYMRDVLKSEPEYIFEQPENILTVRIDKDTGKLANDLTRDAVFEFFREGDEPTEESSLEDYAGLSNSEEQAEEELF